MKTALIIAFLVTLVAVALAALGPSDAPVVTEERAGGQSKLTTESPKNSAQVALDGAIAGRLLSSFDDTASKRGRAQASILNQLEAVRANTAKNIAPQAARAAETMVSVPFVGKLVWANGRDYFDDHNRAWTLFDHALGGIGETLDQSDKAFSRHRNAYEKRLQHDQSEYMATLKSRPNAGPANANLLPLRPQAGLLNVKPRIMRQISKRLREKFPDAARRAASKLGKKQITKAPSAALDGPFPIVETALVVWGLYDVGDGAAALRREARTEVATTIAREGNAIATDRFNHLRSELTSAEKLARIERCKSLRAALSGLIFSAKGSEFAKRCG